MCAGESPRETRQEQRDRNLDPSKQERVVVRARVSGCRDVAADIKPMSQAAAGELGDQRQEAEGEPRQKALVTSRPIHR
jgi:hypothetical protein